VCRWAKHRPEGRGKGTSPADYLRDHAAYHRWLIGLGWWGARVSADKRVLGGHALSVAAKGDSSLEWGPRVRSALNMVAAHQEGPCSVCACLGLDLGSYRGRRCRHWGCVACVCCMIGRLSVHVDGAVLRYQPHCLCCVFFLIVMQVQQPYISSTNGCALHVVTLSACFTLSPHSDHHRELLYTVANPVCGEYGKKNEANIKSSIASKKSFPNLQSTAAGKEVMNKALYLAYKKNK